MYQFSGLNFAIQLSLSSKRGHWLLNALTTKLLFLFLNGRRRRSSWKIWKSQRIGIIKFHMGIKEVAKDREGTKEQREVVHKTRKERRVQNKASKFLQNYIYVGYFPPVVDLARRILPDQILRKTKHMKVEQSTIFTSKQIGSAKTNVRSLN